MEVFESNLNFKAGLDTSGRSVAIEDEHISTCAVSQGPAATQVQPVQMLETDTAVTAVLSVVVDVWLDVL